jgi:AcrR family transcriptional regulator
VTDTPGRRERKKAATRQALAETAIRLFLERGFDDVTVREIADEVDVSTTTLMKYFPTKEALVFDRDEEMESDLIAAVTDRPKKVSALDSLRGYVKKRAARVVSARYQAFMKLVRTTPALSNYWSQMWMRHHQALARALAKDLGRPESDAWCSAMAHFVLEAAVLSEQSTQPAKMSDVAFDILEHGWKRR